MIGQGSFVSKILSCKGDNLVSLNDTSRERNVGVPPFIYFNIYWGRWFGCDPETFLELCKETVRIN